MSKSIRDKANEAARKARAKASEWIEDAKPLIDEAAPILEKGMDFAKSASQKVTTSTKVGGTVGGALGLIVAGTGGMGIAAMGGAIGVPVALVTALVGAGVGSRVGSEREKAELIRKLEIIADERSADGLAIDEHEDFVERIVGKDAHFSALHGAIDSANNTLCIRSGWISSSVINDSLCMRFKEAMERGVTIYIESGWRKSGESKAIETSFTVEAKNKLSELIIFSHNAHEKDPKSVVGRFMVGDVPTHIKEVVVDSDYYISGSNNWLSNGLHSNKEASHIIRLPQIAREIRDETILSVRTHLSEIHSSDI
ncbi:phospholipase D-like domain-containing protein [Marinobacter sp. ANT_B65]|uniref:phospholipase D-like domain-containing protein n=1 Tax=Marinobacter sp. ANT_B65 TaxID=2039467 RepID=UPI000BBEC296|nr:phospholipase D-like domain-containing protein [Marinobacter sp. ANT_B65]PCM43208.1 hypothetical protein CPA50_16855 [Marinobacter sp. ANT_B65]